MMRIVDVAGLADSDDVLDADVGLDDVQPSSTTGVCYHHVEDAVARAGAPATAPSRVAQHLAAAACRRNGDVAGHLQQQARRRR